MIYLIMAIWFNNPSRHYFFVYFNLGVSLYEMESVPGQLETWEKLTLSSDGNTVEKTPYN
ncbi:hypothetical protein ES676_14435 [Bizionia saleffrena]|uniref:Uncharacterized protein n=1 Tax=Bizionia saleffrena TaxID=291189 RepID=A0A8H2LCK0_9FLAO|nr:hypothetical protein [Bizionia saleffrena]TYB69038.1 hypothetical protein ES676_14435 [Bizionia saleffrena]